jgi:hypothetical protein
VARYWKTEAAAEAILLCDIPSRLDGRSISDVSGVVCAARPIDNYRTGAPGVIE